MFQLHFLSDDRCSHNESAVDTCSLDLPLDLALQSPAIPLDQVLLVVEANQAYLIAQLAADLDGVHLVALAPLLGEEGVQPQSADIRQKGHNVP